MSTSSILTKMYDALRNDPTLRRVTCFADPKLTFKLTRQRRERRNARTNTYLLTVGAPNFVERGLIATMVKAGEPFPVKKLKLQEYPAKKPIAKKAVKK
jgi:hypothetical protein